MLRFAFDATASFSHVPLHAATVIGLCTAAFAFLLLPVEFVWYLAGGNAVPGITSTIIVVAFLGGTQLVALGIIGEYVGRIYDEVKMRPLYVVAERSGDGADDGTDDAPKAPHLPPAPESPRATAARNEQPRTSEQLSDALADRIAKPTARPCGDGRGSP